MHRSILRSASSNAGELADRGTHGTSQYNFLAFLSGGAHKYCDDLSSNEILPDLFEDSESCNSGVEGYEGSVA